MIWLGTAVNELYRAGEANQYGFYYQMLPAISFPGFISQIITRYANQADSTEAIKTVSVGDSANDGLDVSHFPIAYSVVSYNADPKPTVSIDSS